MVRKGMRSGRSRRSRRKRWGNSAAPRFSGCTHRCRLACADPQEPLPDPPLGTHTRHPDQQAPTCSASMPILGLYTWGRGYEKWGW